MEQTLTLRQALYSLNKGSHSSDLAVPRRYSAIAVSKDGGDNVGMGPPSPYSRCTISRSSYRIVCKLVSAVI